MSSVAVFVFLLDNLAVFLAIILGFNNALNATLLENAKYMNNGVSPILGKCDIGTTDQILNAVSQDLDLIIVPSFSREDNRLTNEQLKVPSSEIYNTVFDGSKQEAENAKDISADKSYNVIENEFNTYYKREFHKTEQGAPAKEIHEVNNETKIEFPMSAPFLVAIFETLANVTAQTCAGTLLTPRWVLTASNCINLLTNLSVNSPNVTEESHYTVVAGSANPLQDGSAHNVTEVVMHHDFNSSIGDNSYLALMRIEPEVEGPTMELMAEEVNSGNIMVYGWILSKKESEHDTLNRTSTAGQILSPAECQAMYSYRDNDVLCLFSSDMDKNVTQLSSGGPVLMVHDNRVKMLAVVQTDEHVFVSYPLAPHYEWITRTIQNT
uniref:Peptidase S1 domain-containing protein n=1 Tax=Heliothis virescens TaxID=7102 RepID=A0A2A4K6S2_HELVI